VSFGGGPLPLSPASPIIPLFPLRCLSSPVCARLAVSRPLEVIDFASAASAADAAAADDDEAKHVKQQPAEERQRASTHT
jgi:hypothetical protein